jgi:hypothetical protein
MTKSISPQKARGNKGRLAGLLRREKAAPPAPQPGVETKAGNQAAARAPLRAARYPSLYFFQRTVKIWGWLVLSLPLDLLLLIPEFKPLAELPWLAAFTPIIWLCAALAFSFWLREPLIDLVFAADTNRAKLLELTKRHSWIIPILVALMVFAEVASKTGGLNVFSSIAALLITIAAWRSVKESLTKLRNKALEHKTDVVAWIEEANRKVFLASVIPMAAARLISPFGMFKALGEGYSLPALCLWPVASFVLLLAMHPVLEHFMISCKRCGQRTSRVLKAKGFCPWCERNLEEHDRKRARKDPAADKIKPEDKFAGPLEELLGKLGEGLIVRKPKK